jgi:hypothetical protein
MYSISRERPGNAGLIGAGPIQVGIESFVKILGETSEEVNRLYSAPPVHILGPLLISDVSPVPLRIVPTSRKTNAFLFDQNRT